jgi:hypothetical protein
MEENHPVGLESESLRILEKAVNSLSGGFQSLDEFSSAPYDMKQLEDVLMQAAERMKDNFPYFHPMYA